MDAIIDLIRSFIGFIREPGRLIEWGGYPGLMLIIFLETGAMIFFLPGDSLLVMAGFYAAKGDLNLALLNVLLIPMAIIGDAVSYNIGARTGPRLFNRPKSRFFNPEHVHAAHRFYEKYGGKAIVMARFVPVVRTFVPVVAGIAQMTYGQFARYNILGGAGWILSMTCAGYFLGRQFPVLLEHVEKVMLVVIFLSILPAIVEYVRERRKLPPDGPPPA